MIVKESENVFSLKDCKSPIILMSPHSGTNYSKSFMSQTNLSLRELRSSEDIHINAIIGSKQNKCSVISANFPRVFIDVNRSPLDIDPDMLKKNKLNEIFFQDSPKVISGIGVFHRVSFNGHIIYPHKLSINEARKRLFKYYFPYHRKIKNLIKNKKKYFKKIIAIDLHSMASKIVPKNVDVVLSNGFNKTSDNNTITTVKNIFNAHYYKVALNDPFTGGFISQYYGRPHLNVNVIQVEINKKIYMCEKSLEIKEKEMIRLQNCISDLIAKIYNHIT